MLRISKTHLKVWRLVQVAEDSMLRWSEEEKKTGSEIAVASDCSWVTRGFGSLYGVTSIPSAANGKILDYHIASKHCQGAQS